jgi:tRNA uridine 5-carbamoylmethylation protein Kti12
MADSVEGVNGEVQQDNRLFISCASAYTVIHDDLDYYRICARCLLKQFANECEQAYMSIHISQ